MMLIDRRLDMVTPMVTPLTYEGLLDELVGIDCGFINNKSKTAPVAVNLVSLGVHAGNDTLYAEVRDQHVEKFGSFLQNQALVLKESHTNFTSKDTKKNLNEIHQFVKQIPIFTQSLRSLTNHIHLAELIKATTEDSSFRDQWNTERAMIEGESCYDILEECIFTNYPPYKLLRLLCLQSLCSGGIKSNRYDQFKQSIVQVYGYEFLPILHNIEKMGFIKRIENRGGGVFANLADGAGASSGGRSLFQSIKRNLILIHAEVNTTEPDDISYVSSGYAPLTVRLIQSAMQGWIGSGSGSSSSSYGKRKSITTTTTTTSGSSKNSGTKKKKKPTLIVVYLGGITYMEIASLRFLSKRDSFPYHIIVITTKVLNGTKLIQSME
ncbi:Sec1-like protein [Fragilariopsis cylindrus CCMP1102]|uniref:Sec1-like protein n=1 Tax=Fragilariopsis cylindrus CCMP1102 TaxID=635003 RepID=A0A1E7ELX1_9STRA|nr:Sec1-like protein [Fragilariopsis cylindrus CCMP1102]|eukprot:OEU06920.1 Sec1-like protein [Fragilariopsis cylindrus CCMP1102]